MQVEQSKGDKNFTVLSLVITIDPLFRYTMLSFLFSVDCSDIGVSRQPVQQCRIAAASGVWLPCRHVWSTVSMDPCGRCLRGRLVLNRFGSVR